MSAKVGKDLKPGSTTHYLFDHDEDQGEGKEMLTDPWPSLRDKF